MGWKPDNGKKPTLEVSPTGSDTCSVEGCQNPVFSKGMCNSHYQKKRRSAQQETPSAPPPTPIDRNMVESAVIVTMGMLATFVDESFAVLDSNTHKPFPHVDKAIDDMMPWMRVYGGFIVKMFPWIGLGSGLIALSAPALDPALEIVAGIRKPRCMRKSPDDVYTDAYKRARAQYEAKQQAKKEPERQAAKNGEPAPASSQTVETTAVQETDFGKGAPAS